MAQNVSFSRRPYTVTYYKDGERHTIRRRPPAKAHQIWPEDIVSLKSNRTSQFFEGDEVEVRHINPRHPNILQLENDDGATTFVEYFDVELESAEGPRSGLDEAQLEVQNEYLNWP